VQLSPPSRSKAVVTKVPEKVLLNSLPAASTRLLARERRIATAEISKAILIVRMEVPLIDPLRDATDDERKGLSLIGVTLSVLSCGALRV
jgi:hypothetical protein